MSVHCDETLRRETVREVRVWRVRVSCRVRWRCRVRRACRAACAPGATSDEAFVRASIARTILDRIIDRGSGILVTHVRSENQNEKSDTMHTQITVHGPLTARKTKSQKVSTPLSTHATPPPPLPLPFHSHNHSVQFTGSNVVLAIVSRVTGAARARVSRPLHPPPPLHPLPSPPPLPRPSCGLTRPLLGSAPRAHRHHPRDTAA